MRIQLDQLLVQVTEISENCKAEFATGMITEIKRAVVALPTVEELKGQDSVTGRPDARKSMTKAQVTSRMIQVGSALVRAESLLGKT
ncbi:MAG: hypothetical protein Q8P23_02890, partial [bacterium]|nr:hypothetical protein [bacterium]